MRSATNTVLVGMAACDLVTIILPSPWHFQLYTLGYHQAVTWDVAHCYLFEFMCETVPQMFHTASNWLTLGNDPVLCNTLTLIMITGKLESLDRKDWCIFPKPVGKSNPFTVNAIMASNCQLHLVQS